MKKQLLYSILLIGMTGLFASCDELDLSPEDWYGTGNFWKQKSQAEMYMTGIHVDLRNKYKMPVTLGEFRSEILRPNATSLGVSAYGAPMTNNLIDQNNTGDAADWYGLYPNIMHLNLFIKNVDKDIDYMSDAEKAFYLGQAYGMRAYYYFYLYRTFGGVPLETDPKVAEGNINMTELYMERSTPEATLAFIKEDIKKSESNFNASGKKVSDVYEWSYSATEVLKAKVYMWSAKVTTGDHTAIGETDLTVAKNALNEVKEFDLVPNVADLWTPEGKKNQEIILALRFSKSEATNWGNAWLYSMDRFAGATDMDGNEFPTSDPLNLVSPGPFRYEYQTAFIDQYDPEDTRLDATFFQFKMGDGSRGACWKKLLGHTEGDHYFDSDVVIYRYADVLLMLAECENGLNNPSGCEGYINQVRERAYGNTSHNYTAGSFADNEWAILQERDKELVGEGSRWFDLLRLKGDDGQPLVFSTKAHYGSTEPILTSDKAYMMLFPVDINTLNGDPKLKQTPGYEK